MGHLLHFLVGALLPGAGRSSLGADGVVFFGMVGKKAVNLRTLLKPFLPICPRASVRGFCRRGLVWAVLALAFPRLCAGEDETGKDWFVDIAAASGLDFVHFNGMSGRFYYPEVNGPGAALFDYDNDGDLDIYLVQGDILGPGKTLEDALNPPPRSPPRDRLYRNDLQIKADGSRQPHFSDVTEQSGIRARGFGVGVTVADYDRDGWLDLYLTRFGSNQMWRNQGDGSFREVTGETGTGDEGWGFSASFFDFDRDGWLDLYLTNYLKYDFSLHKNCITHTGAQDYCGPNSYADKPDRLYRNLGNGKFEDVSQKAGIQKLTGSGMGVVAGDFNRDGWPDLYVANDGDANFLWINQKNGTFADGALLSGVALNANGDAEAGMGLARGDYDGDGLEDLLVTHLAGETHTLYRNLGDGFFEDVTHASGLGASTLWATGWGAGWLDYDLDGRLDLLVVNGAVKALDALVQRKDPYPLHQPNQLFHNEGGGRLVEVSAKAGAAFGLSEVSRGAAFGDVDNDGDTDVLIINNAGPLRLLMNRVGDGSRWLGIRAVEGKPARDVLGARIALERKGSPTLWRWVAGDGSYLSGHDVRIRLGLGQSSQRATLRILWPTGETEIWTGLKADRYHILRKGGGKKVASLP